MHELKTDAHLALKNVTVITAAPGKDPDAEFDEIIEEKRDIIDRMAAEALAEHLAGKTRRLPS